MIFGNENAASLKSNLNIVNNHSQLKIRDNVKNLGIIMNSKLRFKGLLKKTLKKHVSGNILYNNNLNKRVKSYMNRWSSRISTIVILFMDFFTRRARTECKIMPNVCKRFVSGLCQFDHVSHLYKEIK